MGEVIVAQPGGLTALLVAITEEFQRYQQIHGEWRPLEVPPGCSPCESSSLQLTSGLLEPADGQVVEWCLPETV